MNEEMPDGQGVNLFEHVTASIVGDAPNPDGPIEEPDDGRSPFEIARERINAARGKVNTEAGEARGKNTRKRATTARKTVPASKPGEFVEPIRDLYTYMGMGLSVYDMRQGHVITDNDGNMITPCGMSVIENADKIANAWDELAQKNPAVRKALRGLVTTSIAGQLIAAHAPIVFAIVQGHVIGTNEHNHVDPTDYDTHDADIEGNQAKS